MRVNINGHEGACWTEGSWDLSENRLRGERLGGLDYQDGEEREDCKNKGRLNKVGVNLVGPPLG
jgi:hypothetical protein